jgi:lysophospholipase L1-like esterase
MKPSLLAGSWLQALVIALAGCIPLAASQAASLKLGAMGDSLTDEYWDDGVSSYATNWPELVVMFRGVDMGPRAAQAGTNTWGSPRNKGYKYNWALGGATSASLLSGGQAKGLAAQAPVEGVAAAVLIIGGNDYYPGGSAYTNIYLGKWTQAQITNYGNSVLTNIEKAVVTVQTSGVAVVLGNVVDPGATPVIAGYFSNNTYRDRVAAAISSVNIGLKALASKQHVPLIDLYALQKTVFGPNTNLYSTLTLGNVAINLQASDGGSAHTNAFVSDGYHPNTVLQGIFANLAMQAWNSAYGATLDLLSEREILSAALIPYGGSDTLLAQIGAYSNYVYVPTNIPPTITLPPQSATIAQGSNAGFTVTAASSQPCVYQWRLNRQPLAGATASDLDVIAVQCTNAGSYDVVVTNGLGSVTSSVAALTVVSPPGCFAPPTNRTVILGQSAVFSVTATNSCGGGLTYHWQKAGVSIGGATAGSLTIADVHSSDAGSYAVVVGNLGGSFTSAVATLTVIVPPAISSPPAAQVVARGADASFSVTSTGTGPLAYSWRFGGVAIADATDSAYTHIGIQCIDAGSYDVIVTNAGGSVTSSVANLAVVSPPLFLALPTNSSLAVGQTAAFSVSTTNDCGGGFVYQWQHAGTNLVDATAASLLITNAQALHEGSYTVLVTNLADSVTSAVATLCFVGPPSIGFPPVAQLLRRGADAFLSVGAVGTAPLAYQWRRTRVPIPDATNSVWTRTNVQCADVGGYDVIVTNSLGSVTSSVVLVGVLSPPVFMTSPTDQTVGLGQAASFIVSATNECGSAPSYQWQHAGTNLAGATTKTLSIASAHFTNEGAYAVVARNLGGALTSAVATLTVVVPPAISSGPSNLVSVTGAGAVFLVSASSGALSYTWRFGGTALADGTDSAYTRTNIQCSDAGDYDVIVSNPAGSVTSSIASLMVVSPPLLFAPPTNQTILVGRPVMLSCGVTNDCGGGLACQWRLNEAELIDATNSTFLRTSAQSADSGSYTVVVTNLAGAVTSVVAVLEVTTSLLALTPPTLDFGTVFRGQATNASFVVSNAGIGLLSGTATIPGGPFSLEPGNGAGLAIPVLGSTNLVVRFTPPAAGVFSNVIVFATDGGSTTNSLYGISAELPVLLRAAQAGAAVVFHFPTVSGKNYTLEYKDSLGSQAWLPLQSLVGDGGTNSFTNSTMTSSQRFYRLSAR